MSSKSVSVGKTIIVGVASVLVAGWIVSIGVVRAEPGAPAPATVAPAPLEEPAPDSAAIRSRIAGVGVVDQPLPSVEPIDGLDGAAPAVDAAEPTGLLRQDAPVVADRLVLVGDSLAEATAPVIKYVTPGMEFVIKFWGGTAPCDWVDDDLEATATSVVVITFTGNNLTPCMLDETGAKLIDQPLVDKYRADVGVLIEHATAAGARVVLVGQPLRHPSFEAELEVEGINAVYQEYAATMSGVSYVDAGRYVETPDGRYTDRLPCSELDTDCAPDGTTVVRGDGVHFCPVVDVVPCPVWSSGAVRFGLGIASAATNPADFE
jgi:hypothetical protein